MNIQQSSVNKKGFTIIEVILVLAIAGLIFLMVLVALPALQRGQRDSARKNDVGNVVSSLQSYLSNNRGKFTNIDGSGGASVPTGANRTKFLDNYVKSLNQYTVTGGTINVTWATNIASLPTDSKTMFIYFTAVCDEATNRPTATGATSRSAAVTVQLETSSEYYCQSL